MAPDLSDPAALGDGLVPCLSPSAADLPLGHHLPRPSSDPVPRHELDALSAGVCQALCDSKRLVLLYALRKRSHTVTELSEVIQAARSTTSHHLAVLRSHGLVEAGRQGNNVVYAVCHPEVIAAVDLLRQVMHEELVRRKGLRASPPPGSEHTA